MDPALEWSEFADRILASPKDKAQLLVIAKIAARVEMQALIQFAVWKEDPRDDELLTPAEVAAEFSVKEYSVRESIRRGLLKCWRPCPGAVRGLKVPRGIARAWATKALALLSIWEVAI